MVPSYALYSPPPRQGGAYALVFPGQGTQFVGMGRELCEHACARHKFEEADEALGINLTRLMFEGCVLSVAVSFCLAQLLTTMHFRPVDLLRRTDNAQAAVLTHSVALFAVAEEQYPDFLAGAAAALGHSLGEYTALTVARALSLSDAVRLVVCGRTWCC